MPRDRQIANVGQFRETMGVIFKSPTIQDRLAAVGAEPALWRAFVMNAIERSPELASCTPRSIGLAVMQAASMKLEPNGRDFALVPFGNTCTLIIQYQGMIALAYRSGLVAKIEAEVVYEHDEFNYSKGTGSNEYIAHKATLEDDPGALVCVWAKAILRTGGEVFVVVPKREIMKRKAMSRGSDKPSSPWVKWEPEMWQAKAIRILADFLPQSPEMTNVLGFESATEAGIAPELPLLTIEGADDPFDVDVATREIEGQSQTDAVADALTVPATQSPENARAPERCQATGELLPPDLE